MKRAGDRELLPGNRAPNSPRYWHGLDARLLVAGLVALVFCFVSTALHASSPDAVTGGSLLPAIVLVGASAFDWGRRRGGLS